MSVASRVAGWGRVQPLGRNLPGPFGAGRPPATFPASLLRISVYLALGADLTADPSTWAWTLIPSELVRYQSGITATTGRQDESSQVSPGNGSLVFDNRDGRFSRRNPTGPYYGLLSRNTPILVEVDAGNGAYPLIQQFVNEWPARMDRTLTDFTVPIRTGGIMRRLGQGVSLDESAMRRAIMADPDLVQYWPCEDGEDAQTLASALGVGTSLKMIGGTVEPGSSTVVGAGTDALPVLPTTIPTYLAGATHMDTGRSFTYCASYYFTSVPVYTLGGAHPYILYCPSGSTGTLVRWVLYWKDSDDTLYLTVWNNSLSVVSTIAGPTITNAEMTNCWLTFWVSATQDGSDVDYAFGVERTTTTGTASSTTSGTIVGHTVYQCDAMLAFNGSSAAEVTLGHLFVLSRALGAGDRTPVYGAVNAFSGETATARIERLCEEEGVPLVITSAQGDSETMGPQPRGAFLSLLRECEAVDGGVLYETNWGLGYQPLACRYDVTPAMVLNVTSGHLSAEPEPTDDDQQLRNSWTVARSSGTEATFTDDESIAAEGRYEDSATLNLEIDEQCEQAASWRVHVGTNPDIRWPSISLRFDSAAGAPLIPAWTDMGFGQRITIANPPSQVSTAGDVVDVFVEGKTERVDQFTWTAELNTSPARPYDVLKLNDPLYGRLSMSESTLAVAIDSDDTSLSVAKTDTTTTGVLWTTAASQLPLDIEINGERMTVTAISGATSPQTFTVVRSVNGIVKSHAAHTSAAPVRVTLWRPPVLSL